MDCVRTQGSESPWTAPTALFDPGVTQMYQLLVQLAFARDLQRALEATYIYICSVRYTHAECVTCKAEQRREPLRDL